MAILILTGCAPQIKQPKRICPGKQSVAQSLDSLRLLSQDIVPIRANGQCRLKYYLEEKPHKENFPIKLWVNPPAQIYLQGDVAFNARGLVLGSNEGEFWFSIKPEISSYWWGKWAEQDSSDISMINPKLLLEALGVTAIDSSENWSLANEGAFDILVRQNTQGTIDKKLYIDCCSYRLYKIEYFDVNEQIITTAELDRYREVAEGFFVASRIEIIAGANNGPEDSISINLKLGSVKSKTFSEKLKNRLFTRPPPEGFKHIGRIVAGEVIEQ